MVITKFLILNAAKITTLSKQSIPTSCDFYKTIKASICIIIEKLRRVANIIIFLHSKSLSIYAK